MSRALRAIVVSGCLLMTVDQTHAQVPGPSAQTAADNARGGSVRGRNPGRMVQNGVARHGDFSDRQSAGTVIDAAPTEDPLPGLIAEALEIVFGQINDAITAFRNLLLIRSGQTPVPTAVTNSTATNTTNSVSSNGGGRR